MLVVMKQGATPAQIEAVCGQLVLSNEELTSDVPRGPKASGTLESHYAPNAKLRLMDAKALQAALDLLGTDMDAKKEGSRPASAVIAIYSRTILRTASTQVLRRRMPDDAAATAQQLFAVLRDFDVQGVKLIWVETPSDAPDWDGVRDRLTRASAG